MIRIFTSYFFAAIVSASMSYHLYRSFWWALLHGVAFPIWWAWKIGEYAVTLLPQ